MNQQGAVNRQKKHSSWLLMLVLALVPLLMVLGNSALIPVLPDMQSELHVSKLQVSLLITLFSVPAGISIPVFGFVSDQISRKWIMIPSLLLFGVGGVIAGCAAMWFSHPYTWILGARILQGIGGAGTAPIAMATVADLFSGPERSRALGINEAGNAFGKVISPILGSAVALLAWSAVFFIFPVLCVPLTLAIWFLIPKLKSKSNKMKVKEYFQTLITIAKREGGWLSIAYLSGAAALFTLFGVLFYLSDLLETKYRVEGMSRGLIIAIPLLLLTITNITVGSIIKNRTLLMKWFMIIGFCIMGGTLALASFFGDKAWLLTGLLSGSAIGTGCVLPCLNTFITSAVKQEQRGLVTSFYGSVRFLGVAAGPPVFTWLLDWSTRVMFWSVTGLALVCGALCFIGIHPDVKEPSSEENEKHKIHVPGRQKARV